jgi:D-xylose transport system permease protein
MSEQQTSESQLDEPNVALSDDELATVAPEVLANSTNEYFKAWWLRIKNGESGALPVVIGLIAIVIFFEIENSSFLHASNLVNLFTNASVYILFGAAQIFVLLLSEIDLSLGFGGGCSALLTVELVGPNIGWPWWLAVLAGLALMAIIGIVNGTLVSRLGLPSFIVTLGGYLGFQGLLIQIANWDPAAQGGSIQLNADNPISKLVASHMSPTLGWIVTVVCIAAFAAYSILRNRSRTRQGLSAKPLGVVILGIAAVAIIGVVLMLIFNSNQSLTLITTIEGTPWVIPFVLIVLLICGWFMSRTRSGRYIYAVGNSPEAARRAGIKVKWIIVLGFVLANVVAGLAALIEASNSGGMSTDFDGGQYVLYAVAAAVIGGTSLFGGRGKIANALLGGIVIGTVYNGLELMGVSAALQYIVTAVVLVAAVSLDALVRRRAATAGRGPRA